MPSFFDIAFERTVGLEGGFQRDHLDRGNWTGGAVGKGQLRGTKYGISAAAFPDLDIQALSLAMAKEIYAEHYWGPVHGDDMPLALACQTFDFAVHSGVRTAIKGLQRALRVIDDGHIGPKTVHAMRTANSLLVGVRLMAERIQLQANAPGWPQYGKGWARRNAGQLEALAQDCEGAEDGVT